MVYMNEDGSLGIPHGAPQEEKTPVAEPVFSSNQEGIGMSPTIASGVDDNIAATHDSPIEAPITTESNDEPVDIFASSDTSASEEAAPAAISSGTSERHIASNPFHSRNRFQSNASTNTTLANSNVPQFFNDAIVANTPIERPRQSKKGLLIGVAIGAILLIGIVVGVTLFINKSTQENNPASLGKNTKKLSQNVINKFNKYANFIISGNANENDIPASRPFDCKISEIYASSTDVKKNYIETANNLFNEFTNEFKKEIELTAIVKSYQDNLNATVYSLTTEPLSIVGNVYDKYIQSGKSAAEQYVNSYLGSDLDKNIVKSREKTYYYALVEELELFKNNSCIKNGEVITSCTDKIASSGKQKIIDKVQVSYDEIQMAIEATRAAVINDIWDVKASVLGEEK